MSGRAARRSVSHRLSDLRFALKNRAVLGLDATRDVRRAVRKLRRFRTQFHGLGCGWFAESMREHDLSTARSEAMTRLYERLHPRGLLGGRRINRARRRAHEDNVNRPRNPLSPLSKEEKTKRAPLPPETLADAIQTPAAPTSGPLIRSTPITKKDGTK